MKGGAKLSETWEAASGTAIRYDCRRDPAHDFFKDTAFWEEQLRNPKDAYHWAFPCRHMSKARTTPYPARSLDEPMGDPSDPETLHYNKMAFLMMERILQLCAKGALILVEQPLFTFLYWFRAVLGFIGMPGVAVWREDDCTYGTPFKKARARLSTNGSIAASAARVCCHPQRHPGQLVGSKARQSAPYPSDLCVAIVQGIIAELKATGHLTNATATASARLYLQARLRLTAKNATFLWRVH